MESGDTVCFVCHKGKLLFSSSSISVPHFGEVNITTFVCNSCGYRSTDVIPIGSRPPSRYRCTINGEESLSIRVIRSHTGIITIPEIGMRIDPGVAAEGFITNTEGILNRALDIIDQVLRDSYTGSRTDGLDEDECLSRITRCLQVKDRIESARSGSCPMTLILEDPSGNSAIIGDDPSISRSDLSDDEIRALMSGAK
jgi:zinc finger protein